MTQLWSSAPMPDGIDLRCGGTLTGIWQGALAGQPTPAADLVMADPPWSYSLNLGEKLPADHYAGLSTADIAAHVREAASYAREGARLALWCTFPLLAEWMAHDLGAWQYKTGGGWLKQGGTGQGYHWRGDAEVVLVYVRRGAGSGRPLEVIRNGHASKRGKHSAKPIGWQRAMIRAWSPPGGLVLDMYAGLGSVAVACAVEGRRYIGWEIDPVRHAEACDAVRAVAVTP